MTDHMAMDIYEVEALKGLYTYNNGCEVYNMASPKQIKEWDLQG
jgi:hypothetical protein